MKSDNANVTIEVEDGGKILLVLDRKADHLLIPWQDAYRLAETLGMAINDARNETDIFDAVAIRRESGQIRLGTYRGYVSLVFEYGDRLPLSWRAAELVAQALKIKAQDVQYAERLIPLPTLQREGKLQGLGQLVR